MKNKVSGFRFQVLPLILLLGFGLRLYNLTYHSIWFDEAISIRWARSSVPKILDVSMKLVDDRLPPLYYLSLKGWVDLTGLSDFSLRYLSVLFGVALIAVMYALGKRLYSRQVGWLAALLTALNPFLIWYSQEARMYAMAVFWGSLGVLCFVMAVGIYPLPTLTLKGRGLISPPPLRVGAGGSKFWLGLGLCALAGLYTHLYTGFLWPALALWLLLNPRYLKRYWLPFGLTMLAVALLFTPLALANWRFSGESVPGNPLADVWGRALDLFKAFTLWQAPLPAQNGAIIIAILGGFLLLGLGVALFKRQGWLLILLLLAPFIIASLLLLRSNLAFFGQRYFIVMLPWVLLLQGVGAVWLIQFLRRKIALPGTILGGVAVIILVGATAIPIPGQWSVEASKEAWRQTTAYMTGHVQPQDGIFIHPEWVRFPYQYYAGQMQTPGQTYAAFFAVSPETELDGPLNGILNDHPVIWLIQSHLDEPDPERRVENWFAVRYPLVTELYPPGLTLKAYAPGYQLESLPAEATPTEATFASGLRLQGFSVAESALPAGETLFHPPSNWLHVTLYWSADGPVAEETRPYIHLVDELGQVWGANLERGNDALAFYPPSRWTAGQVIRHDVDVNLNPLTPPGVYYLVVGEGADSIRLAKISVL